MKRILVPTDFSDQSRYALVAAAGMAEQTGATVTLLHVITGKEDDTEARRCINEQIRLSGFTEGHIEGFVKQGHPMEEVIHYPADLIVMGSKGAHGLKSFFLGSNAESVAKHAMAPVITIKGPTDLMATQKIAFATDLRNEQEEIIEELVAFQRQVNAGIHLVKVHDSRLVKTTEVEKRMRQFADRHGIRNYTVNARGGTNEVHEIIDFAKEINADMVAMATHDRHGLERLFGGIISGGVINEIDLPIWTKSILYSE